MTAASPTLRVGFLGLGRMGAPMARHVVAGGHDVVVWNRTAAKAEPFAALGARVASTPADAATARDAIVLMLADPDAVADVLFGPSGVVEAARPGALVIDASTIGPDATRDVARRLGERGLRYVDAPVNGSVGPATAGTLGVLIGGSDGDVAAAMPLLRLWGDPDNISHVGPTGAGSAAKLVRNLTLAVAIAGVGDALRLGASLGLPPDVVADVVTGGPLGATLPAVRAADEAGPGAAAGFTLEMLVKDLGLCLAADAGLRTAEGARAAGQAAIVAGHGQADSRLLAAFIRDER